MEGDATPLRSGRKPVERGGVDPARSPCRNPSDKTLFRDLFGAQEDPGAAVLFDVESGQTEMDDGDGRKGCGEEHFDGETAFGGVFVRGFGEIPAFGLGSNEDGGGEEIPREVIVVHEGEWGGKEAVFPPIGERSGEKFLTFWPRIGFPAQLFFLTGFLGAGKTTLRCSILKESSMP